MRPIAKLRPGFLLGFLLSCPLLAQQPASTLPLAASPQTSAEYRAVQQRLARGWNTWDAHSVATHVLLPEGLAIHVGLKHNTTESHEAFLRDSLIGRLAPGAEQVTPGPHAWDGSYTDLRTAWMDHAWRVQSAHAGSDLVLLVTPLPSTAKTALPPTVVFSVDLLWNRPGTVSRAQDGTIEAHTPGATTSIFCTCASASTSVALPVASPYFAADLTEPIALSTGSPRTVSGVQSVLARAEADYQQSLGSDAATRPILDAIETTLGWDTTYEPEKHRVFSPVSRIWSVDWGGYVLFDWDTFFAATMASLGDRDLAYADALETLREATDQGFVPNYARGGNWKSFDRSEPPVGAITVLGLYRRFHDRWFIEDAFPALLRWNRWWAQHRDYDGYLAWGSDDNPPGNLDDNSRGTRVGAILESGLDNSPMYDDASYDAKRHVLAFADVGLMSMYIADCQALATIADELQHSSEASELRGRAASYSAKLQTLWSPEAGIFLNKDLRTGTFSPRLSPTNFYPLLSKTATPAQASAMIDRHMLNPQEFWGDWVLPSVARNDPAFHDQNYWRGRIWGPLNYLVYLGLANYPSLGSARTQLAAKSYALFLKEWRDKGHVHENYNAISGTGDDVANSDRFYHWGALLGYVEYLEQQPR